MFILCLIIIALALLPAALLVAELKELGFPVRECACCGKRGVHTEDVEELVAELEELGFPVRECACCGKRGVSVGSLTN